MQHNPHRRFNPLTEEWILVSPQRDQRPWQGQQESSEQQPLPEYDQLCYLCPGNQRNQGASNPDYDNTYVFTNDFPALLPNTTLSSDSHHPLFQQQSVTGTCRVICFSPRHDLTLANMPQASIISVIDCWQAQLTELEKQYRWVQIFENKGQMMGCSNPHPHGQIWASQHLPNEAVKECRSQKNYFEKYQIPLLLDYAHQEIQQQKRVVCNNSDWLVVVPYWATWPFETLLLPRFQCCSLTELKASQKKLLASILQQLTLTYNQLFNIEFPYTMGWHNAPADNQAHPEWQCHAHFYPPLLRSASVKKFMVGYELLAESQRDITAEKSAQQLRSAFHESHQTI